MVGFFSHKTCVRNTLWSSTEIVEITVVRSPTKNLMIAVLSRPTKTVRIAILYLEKIENAAIARLWSSVVESHGGVPKGYFLRAIGRLAK